MKDEQCVRFLQQVLLRLHLRWLGFCRLRRQVCKRLSRHRAEVAALNRLVRNAEVCLSDEVGKLEWLVASRLRQPPAAGNPVIANRDSGFIEKAKRRPQVRWREASCANRGVPTEQALARPRQWGIAA